MASLLGPRLPLELVARIIDVACAAEGLAYRRGPALGWLTLCRALVEPCRASVFACWYRERELELATLAVDLGLNPGVAALVRDVDLNSRVMGAVEVEMMGMVTLGVLQACPGIERLGMTCPVAAVSVDRSVPTLARLNRLRYFSLEFDSTPQDDYIAWPTITALVAQHWPQLRTLQLGLHIGVTASTMAPIAHSSLVTLRLYNPMSEAPDELFRLMGAMPLSLRRLCIVRDMQRVTGAIMPGEFVRAIGVVAARLEALEIFEQTHDKQAGEQHLTQALATDNRLLINAAALFPLLTTVRSLALLGTATSASALRQIPVTVERLHLCCHRRAGHSSVIALVKSGALPALRCVRARARDPSFCPDGWTPSDYAKLKVRDCAARS